MNKLTSTLAGLALAAAVSVAPAFAQSGNLFSPPGSFTFTGLGSSFEATGSGATFNPSTGAPITGVSFDLKGTFAGTSPTAYTFTSLMLSGPITATELGAPQFNVNPFGGAGGVTITSAGAASDGSTFNLVSPVPEASTVVSFGALLALGGLAVLRRKSVKNAA